jgi:hypothetical protein
MMNEPRPGTGKLDAARLWPGGVATAVVAALIAVVGILLARGVLDVPVLSPKGEGVWGNANTVTYALVAAGVALVATGLMQLLSVTTPRFRTFFSWIMVLLTAIAVVVPLSLPIEWESKLATAVINFVIGIAITTMLNGVARSAYRRARQAPGSEPGPAGATGMPPPW